MITHSESRSVRSLRPILVILGWMAFAIAAGYYLVQAIEMRFLTPGQMGSSLWNRQAWFYLHLGFALPSLLIGPFQFSARLRFAKSGLHRRLGQSYVICATVSALSALTLAITSEYPMDRPALTLLAALWLFFTLSGYVCARRRDFTAHRLFMIRSYAAVIAFVVLRLFVEAPIGRLLSFITNPDALEAVETWMAVAVMVLGTELVFSWIPQMRGRTVIPARSP